MSFGFNRFAWDLYRQSEQGKSAIECFSSIADSSQAFRLIARYNPQLKANEVETSELLDLLWYHKISDYQDTISEETFCDIYEEIISTGLVAEGDIIVRHGDYSAMLNLIPYLSMLLNVIAPDYYFPYLFGLRFYDLKKISDAFDIDLPVIPKKPDYKSRCLYYLGLCKVMRGFMEENRLTPSELSATLYDFAPKYIADRAEDTTVLRPSRAWFIGGKTNRLEENMDFLFWQANPETKRGDILVHYEKYPTCAITSIFISQTDGVIDPFFHYYSNCYIGNRKEIPHITLEELKRDEYFATSSLVRKNFQGVNGWAMTSEDYSRLMWLISVKGGDVDGLPKLYAPDLPKNVVITDERSVETQLLEPLLERMGYVENINFKRQIPVKAGRGHRIFPDYALHYCDEKNNEAAKVVIEAKLWMNNNQEIEAAFTQGRSYAGLLNAQVLCLCDKQCILVYERHNGAFDRSRYQKFYWGDLENPDNYKRLFDLLNV